MKLSSLDCTYRFDGDFVAIIIMATLSPLLYSSGVGGGGLHGRGSMMRHKKRSTGQALPSILDYGHDDDEDDDDDDDNLCIDNYNKYNHDSDNDNDTNPPIASPQPSIPSPSPSSSK